MTCDGWKEGASRLMESCMNNINQFP